MAHRFSPTTGPGPGRCAALAGALALLLALGGCASVPPPDAAMSQAQSLLQSARQAGASDYDPVDYGFAQDKFRQAQAAMAGRKYALAADLADESSADATLARTKALLGAARAQIQLKKQANDRLQAQNQEAKAENAQHEAQQRAQLAQQQAAVQPPAADGQPGQAAPAASASAMLPAQAPVQQDMPAPSSSALSVPQGDGFQTVPDAGDRSGQGQPGQGDQTGQDQPSGQEGQP